MTDLTEGQAILDASVPIAFFKKEPGWEKAVELLPQGLMSPINMMEVSTYLAREVTNDQVIQQTLKTLPVNVTTLSANEMMLAGTLIRKTRPYGLSLGDRACLALAMVQKLPVYTTDRIWGKLDIGVEIHLLR